MTLEEFVAGMLSGVITYPAAQYLFDQFVPGDLTARVKRITVFVICGILTLGALGLGSWLGYTELTPDTMFGALFTAFTTSQALHTWLGLKAGTRP